MPTSQATSNTASYEPPPGELVYERALSETRHLFTFAEGSSRPQYFAREHALLDRDYGPPKYVVADESLDIFAAHLQQQLSAASAAEIEYATQQPLKPNGPILQHPTRRMLTWERRLVRVWEWYATQARKDLRVSNDGSPYWRNPLSLLAIITGWSSRYRPFWDALAAEGEGTARAAMAQLLLMAESREEAGQ